MKFQIKKIILWPKDSEKSIRQISFDLDKINIISGESGRGKSALTYIIDYCLGSSKCAIPTGLIRNVTEWFGILIQFGDRQLLLARKEPSLGLTDMYNDEAKNVLIPDALERNCIPNDVKSLLNQYLKLINIDFTFGEERGGFKDPPSVRDLTSLMFQPQHIVANAYALFYKADTYENREKLKTIFPYILGIIDDETLELKEELKQLKRRKSKLDNELNNRQSRVENWTNEVKNYYSQANSYGLIPNAPNDIKDFQFSDFIKYLRIAANYLNNNKIPQIELGLNARIASRIALLQDQEMLTAQRLHETKEKLISIKSISKTNNSYGNSILYQKDRTKGSSWFKKVLEDSSECQFCGSLNTNSKEYVNFIDKINRELTEISFKVSDFHKVFSKETKLLEKALKDFETELNNIRSELKNLVDQDSEFKRHRQTLNNIYRFVGGLDEAFKNFDAISPQSDLSKRINDINERIKKINSKINQQAIDKRKKAAIGKLSKLISFYSNIFKAERSSSLIELDLNNLTLKFNELDGASDFLWEIGSGHNYMSYHISTILALHEFFLGLEGKNKIPQLIILDQPSQVYFPELKDDNSLDDDLDRVSRIFEAVSIFHKRTKNQTQIIILEHVGEKAWTKNDNIKLLKRWRKDEDDNALIPQKWIP